MTSYATFDRQQADEESGLLVHLKVSTTLAEALGEDPAKAVTDLVTGLLSLDFLQLIESAEIGQAMRLSLKPLATLCASPHREIRVPTLGQDDIAWVLHCTRAMVWLRLAPALPPQRTAHLVLAGAAALYGSDAAAARTGLAGWCRLLRAPALRALG